MSDLTKMTLKEVQDLVHPLNQDVRIYANDGSSNYPIHGAIRVSRGWEIQKWTRSGKWLRQREHNRDLILTKPEPTIDWFKMPKDILVEYLADNGERNE
jgi:hypothetical protein